MNNFSRILLRRFVVPAVCSMILTSDALPQTYDSQGKRDPFIGPAITKEKGSDVLKPPPLEQRPPGLAGLLIAEVTVAGTAGSQQEQVVILKGVDKISYLARKGSKLYDGFLSEITTDKVVFIRETIDMKGAKKTGKVVKSLYTEDK